MTEKHLRELLEARAIFARVLHAERLKDAILDVIFPGNPRHRGNRVAGDGVSMVR